MIKVLVVDDSTIIRKIIVGVLEQHPQIKTITATNGKEALEKIQSENPDVVTLDIDMPIMSGLETLKKIMEQYPRPVIMISAHAKQGEQDTLQAFKFGAVDCIPKINPHTVFLNYIETELLARVLYFGKKQNFLSYSKNFAPLRTSKKKLIQIKKSSSREKIILIGASTGGPLVIQHILSSISGDFHGILIIALHMPQGFSSSFVERLQKLCPLHVSLIRDNEAMQAKTVYICCGGYQTAIEQQDTEYIFKVSQDNGLHPYKPSIDLLFSSVSLLPSLTDRTMVFILTGMGHDGLIGCRELAKHNVPIYAQDEESSVVFGMPKAVIKASLAKPIALDEISKTIEAFSRQER